MKSKALGTLIWFKFRYRRIARELNSNIRIIYPFSVGREMLISGVGTPNSWPRLFFSLPLSSQGNKVLFLEMEHGKWVLYFVFLLSLLSQDNNAALTDREEFFSIRTPRLTKNCVHWPSQWPLFREIRKKRYLAKERGDRVNKFAPRFSFFCPSFGSAKVLQQWREISPIQKEKKEKNRFATDLRWWRRLNLASDANYPSF